jgi:hypothetical protein
MPLRRACRPAPDRGSRGPALLAGAWLAWQAPGCGKMFGAFRVTSGPYRFMSLFAGVLSLAALIAGELGDNSFFVKSIGIGGTERWQVFPIILWLPFFGGYLLASGHRRPPDRHGPAAVDGSAGAHAEPPAAVPAP